MGFFPFSFVDRDMFMRFLGTGIGHCSQHSAEMVGIDANGSQMCIDSNDAEDANDGEEDEELEDSFDDEDEIAESEGDMETEDDDVGYDAL